MYKNKYAFIAQLVEHLRGKQEVAGSIPAGSSIIKIIEQISTNREAKTK